MSGHKTEEAQAAANGKEARIKVTPAPGVAFLAAGICPTVAASNSVNDWESSTT